MNESPLISHYSPEQQMLTEGRSVYNQGQMIDSAIELASKIPEHKYVINLCANRHQFVKAFMAAILDKKITLLPASKTNENIFKLSKSFENSIVVSDQRTNFEGVKQFLLPKSISTKTNSFVKSAPLIGNDQLCVFAFTSGTTGAPTIHPKSWRTLSITAGLLARRFGLSDNGYEILATVPTQHMYGLEMTALVSLQGMVKVSSLHPFYPKDILLSLKENTILVTTPIHLKALIDSKLEYPQISKIISATAPLSIELAQLAGDRFGCGVEEIYGCTEGGSIATRETIKNELWKPLDGITVTQDKESFILTGSHLSEPIHLQDQLVIRPEGFKLEGRNTDMLNVGGKRYSLADLNLKLSEIKGITDSIVFLRDPLANDRPVAIVVSSRPEREIKMELAKKVDPVFVPRPILIADRLPRNETGKLIQASLIKMLNK